MNELESENREVTASPVMADGDGASTPREPFRSRVAAGLLSLLYILPLAPIFGLGGYMPAHGRLLAIYALLALPLCLKPSRRSLAGLPAMLAVMMLRASVAFPPLAEICLLLLLHQSVWALAWPVPARLSRALLVYTLVHTGLFLSPLGHPLVEALSSIGGRTAAAITRDTYRLGPTYQNVGAFLLFLCLSVLGWDRTFLSKARTASFLAIALLANVVLCGVLVRYVDFGADFAWELKYREAFGYGDLLQRLKGLCLLVYPFLSFAAFALVYLFLHHETASPAPGPAPPVPRPRRLARIASTALPLTAVLLVCLVTPPTAWRRPTPSSLVLVERGVVSFTRPDYSRFGRAAGGMYGMLPDYVRLFGCRAEVVPDVPDRLDPQQILVFTNLDEPLAPEVHARIWAFVRNGGRMWVLGDHTFIKNGRNHINDLLAPSHISLNHDSAQFFPQGWFNSYRFLQGTSFSGVAAGADNRPAILVGASLDVGSPAMPLVMGTFGYGDLGPMVKDPERGYLGDFEYQRGERLGDLVLVAGERVGKGKVLVFGDTTSFFNNNLSRSYDILRAVLSWFGEDPAWSAFSTRPVRIAALAVAIAFLALAALCKSTGATATTLVGLLVLSSIAHRPTGVLEWDTTFARQHMAVLDFSHQPYASKHSSMDTGLHGLSINLMRYGHLPVAVDEWDRDILDAATLVILNAPRQKFSRRQCRDLDRALQRGGNVLLACGHPHAHLCRRLLDHLGIDIRGLPLGRFFDRDAFGARISFLSAWPILVGTQDAETLCRYDEWPLVVALPRGKGRVVVIGDSEFLHNRNIEGMEKHDPANVQFLKALFAYFAGGEAE